MSEDSQKQKAVMYTRVASEVQSSPGFSLHDQKILLRDYSSKKGFDLVAEFEDLPGPKSSFQQMVTYLRENPEVRVVLVEKQDRLLRNFFEKHEVDNLGLELHFVREGQVITPNSTGAEKMLLGLRIAIGQHFREQSSLLSRRGLLRKAQSGRYPGRAPTGYLNSVDPSGHHALVPDPQTAPMVQRMFRQFASGTCSLTELRKWAADRGYGLRVSARLSNTWVRRILTCLTYTGWFSFMGEVFKGSHEPLVSRETFDRVQELLARGLTSKR